MFVGIAFHSRLGEDENRASGFDHQAGRHALPRIGVKELLRSTHDDHIDVKFGCRSTDRCCGIGSFEYAGITRDTSGFKCLPIVFKTTMAVDIPTYHKLGARHFHYMHVVAKNWGNKALTNWQMARQIWDVETDCPKLWEDYFARRYDVLQQPMRLFYDSLEAMLCNVAELKYGLCRRLDQGAKDLFPKSHLRATDEDKRGVSGPTLEDIAESAEMCRKLIDNARAAAPARIIVRSVA